LDGRLVGVWTINLRTTTRSSSAKFAVQLKQLSHVEARLLDNLHFADEDVLQRIDGRADLLNVLSN
jgi:hypothetical protein